MKQLEDEFEDWNPDDLPVLANELGNLKRRMNSVSNKLADLKAEYAQKAQVILDLQRRTGSKSTVDATKTFTLTRKSLTNVEVVDYPATKAWVLKQVEEDPEVYNLDLLFPLSLKTFKPLAKHVLETDGELVPGTALVETESLQIRDKAQGAS